MVSYTVKAFVYIRVSSKGQIEGDGPERQRTAINTFRAAHGLEFAGEFFEQGVSGTVEGMDRPAFSEMISYARDRDIKVIVVERMDRLARDLMVQEFLLAECRRVGISVFSVDQGALVDMASNGGDPTRILIRQILGALAQWEKSALVNKLRSARQRVKAQTGKCEGGKLFGHLKDRPEEKKIADMILKFHSSMDMRLPSTQKECCAALNEMGYKTRKGQKWSPRNVLRLCKRLTKENI